MYGRIARLSIDININIINPSEQLQNNELPNPDIDLIEEDRAVVNADIMKNIKKLRKQSKYYNKKHGAGSSFVVGAPVLNATSYATYSPITFQDQQRICSQLKLSYICPSKQHSELTDVMLSHYIPAKTKSILAGGNCLFRTFSYLITGSEKSHMKVRGLLCCFMLGAGRLQC